PLTWSASCSARSSSRRRSNEHESLHAYAKSFFDPQRGEPMTTMNDNHLSKSLSARASVKSKGRKKEGVSEPLPPSPGQQGGTPTVVSNPETKTAGGDRARWSKSLELSEAELQALFKRLNLAHMRRIHKEVVRQAEKESWSYRNFLSLLLAEEVARRKQT